MIFFYVGMILLVIIACLLWWAAWRDW